MKQLQYIGILLICLLCFSCAKVEIPDAPDFDLTEIVAFKAYDSDKKDIATDNPVIDAKANTITVSIRQDVNLKSIFSTCGLSSGATISPLMNGYEDWSAGSRTYVVTSASGKRTQQWTITLKK